MSQQNSFYSKAELYWKNIEATPDGVLGGFGFISEIDLNGSDQFLKPLIEERKLGKLALDCGAGIGRITKGLLIKYFEKVDLVEQNPTFLDVAAETIEPKDKLGELYPLGLQNFLPSKKYDIIWSQWVLGHLTNDDLIRFLSQCKRSLSESGLIVVKENVTSSGKLEKDKIDSSVTRPLDALLTIFKKAGLIIVHEHKQEDFPKGLYPVHIFALQPKTRSEALKSDRLLSKLENLVISKSSDGKVLNTISEQSNSHAGTTSSDKKNKTDCDAQITS